jgi:co-chaperonin GroES (HSP10)
MKVVPLHDNVLVKRDKVEEKKTPGGVIVPKTGQKAPVFCTVLDHGPDCILTGTLKKGARVIVSTYAGVDIELGDGEDDKVIMVKEADVLGRVEE